MTETVTYDQLLTRLASNRESMDESAALVIGEAIDAITALQNRVTELEDELTAVEDRKKWRKERQHEGIVAAQDRGVTFGRPRLPLPDNFEDVKNLWMTRQISSRTGAKMLGISQDTFLRWCRTR
ncbi:MAG: hypothetical protein LJU34_10130 [Oscillospiraceae bacterium]|nr:hypothetical protein [Oscillospiraceae bacterium]